MVFRFFGPVSFKYAVFIRARTRIRRTARQNEERKFKPFIEISPAVSALAVRTAAPLRRIESLAQNARQIPKVPERFASSSEPRVSARSARSTRVFLQTSL